MLFRSFKEHNIELPVADLRVAPKQETELRAALRNALELGKGFVLVLSDLDALEGALGEGLPAASAGLKAAMFSTKRACPSCGTSFAEADPRLFSYNSKHGWCTSCFGTGVKLAGFRPAQHHETDDWQGADRKSTRLNSSH